MQRKTKPRVIAAAEFKAKCLQLMTEVYESKTPIVVTKHGKPVVTIVPASEEGIVPFGDMKGQITIKGDIVGPTGESWSAEADK